MKLSDFRSNAHWQKAIDMAPRLMQLADELPASEQMGLSLQMRQTMVDLPVAIAADIIDGTDTRRAVGLRLMATVELVDHVYPALDTADIRAAVDAFVEQLLEDAKKPVPATVPSPALPADSVPVTPAGGTSPSLPNVIAVPPKPEYHTGPSAMPTIVSVSGAELAEDSNVQPNSGQ